MTDTKYGLPDGLAKRAMDEILAWLTSENEQPGHMKAMYANTAATMFRESITSAQQTWAQVLESSIASMPELSENDPRLKGLPEKDRGMLLDYMKKSIVEFNERQQQMYEKLKETNRGLMEWAFTVSGVSTSVAKEIVDCIAKKKETKDA